MQISEIMEQIIAECRQFGAQEVILFGSRAKGTAKACSDFDITVTGVADVEGLRVTKRFESYKKSLASLAEARERDLSDSFVLSGTSAKFCITFDFHMK